MKRSIAILIDLILMGCLATTGWAQTPTSENPRVCLTTNQGDIILELDSQAAPVTVENFLTYVKKGFYDGTVFHRVIKGFMIQGGGLTADLRRKATRDPIVNEADNGLKNRRGTIAMARTSAPHSATAQFFINTVDNDFLNHKAKTNRGWGYCVFGRVIEGLPVVVAIEAVPTAIKNGARDVPVAPVIIEHAAIMKIAETSETGNSK